MSEARLRHWPLKEFLAWEERQPARYELVDGEPRLMTGGTQAHWIIGGNIVAALKPLLRGSSCRASGSDIRLVTGNQNVRYPDAVIDCGPLRPGAHEVSDPTVVFEVLSRSTAWTDLHHKLRDYDATPGIRHYVIVAQDESRVEFWMRENAGRLGLAATLTGLDEFLTIDPPGVRLEMAEIYEGLGIAGPAEHPRGTAE